MRSESSFAPVDSPSDKRGQGCRRLWYFDRHHGRDPALKLFDLVIIGGGVLGCATGRAFLLKHPHARVLLVEKEPELAMHQSGRNSGVVHAGFNQKPGTTKARYVVEGSRRLRSFCHEHNVAVVENGIVVVARTADEEAVLEELYKRGTANGTQVEIVTASRLQDLEPNAPGISALWAPEGASFDARSFVRALAADFTNSGGQIASGEKVIRVEEIGDAVLVHTEHRSVQTNRLLNAGGLWADRLAHCLNAGLQYHIVPFRGQYYELVDNKRALIRGHVYAPPDLSFPFLGVHFSRTFDGHVTIGPGAVLALGRNAYDGDTFINWADVAEMACFSGFWRMFASADFRHMATREWRKSISKSAVVAEAQQLIPQVRAEDFLPFRSGIRAQLVRSDGVLIDDLVIEQTPNSVHVLNAVSPALTCSLPFADHLVALLS